MIRGITIKLRVKKEVAKDEYNIPVIEETWEDIDNVLVAPTSSDDLIRVDELKGSKTLYTIAIPKTDHHDWHGCSVKFFGYEWEAVGEPIKGIDQNVPTPWNEKVVVERIDIAK